MTRHGRGARHLTRVSEILSPLRVLVVEVGHNRGAAEAAFPHLPFCGWARRVDDAVFLLNARTS